MKNSELLHLAQMAVLASHIIAPETKIDVLRLLMDKEETELFCEKREETQNGKSV